MVKTAQEYDVTFPFGATDGVYYAPTRAQSSRPDLWIGPEHRGDDRAMPMRTPIPVNGQEIGLSGNGSGRYDPHLHIGKFKNYEAVNPNGQGFQLDNPMVFAVNHNPAADPINGKWVKLIDDQGIVWVYLHLEEIFVKPGDRIGGNMETITKRETLRRLFRSQLYDRDPTEQDYKDFLGKDVNYILDAIDRTPDRHRINGYVWDYVHLAKTAETQLADLQAKLDAALATTNSEAAQALIDIRTIVDKLSIKK